MKYLFYANGGSGNHGCEAIVRGTCKLLGNDAISHSALPDEDKKYGLNEIIKIESSISPIKKNLDFIKAYFNMKLKGEYLAVDGLQYMPVIRSTDPDVQVALSVGGDNYCYGNTEIYAYLNKAYKKQGIKTVLWGCSIEPDVVKEPDVIEDLKNYDLIVARESITYKAVKEIGANVILSPDPAFYMDMECTDIDESFFNNAIGINMSPYILTCENSENIAYTNMKNLIEYILNNTDYNIALIPHVVWDSNDDRKVINQLYDDFNQNKRLKVIEDHTAPELKYIISKCKMFIGARTHATIAAYSTYVPTLVLGYSVKSIGIAGDLFKTDKDYVLSVRNLQSENDLVNSFLWLDKNQDDIRNHLISFIPEYIKRSEETLKILEGLLN